jgi:hypothetical protein
MSTAWVPPRRSYYLRVFAISLTLLAACLCGFLFGVRLEAIAPASGTVSARDLKEVRAPLPGLIEPGWYEGEIPQSDSRRLRVRLDAQGHGVTDSEQGSGRTVDHHELTADGQRLRIAPDRLRFHKLQPGDKLWPGQPLAVLRPTELRARLDLFDPRLPRGENGPESSSAIDLFRPVRFLPPQTVLRVPDSGSLWLAVNVPVAPQQAVQPGDLIAAVVPLDPETHRPRDLVARLEIDEKHWGEVEPGQTIRLYSTMYNPRLHGHAEARIERLEPWGEEGSNGRRRFHAVAAITDAPFALWLGSSFKGEVVLGKKRVYRLILEN